MNDEGRTGKIHKGRIFVLGLAFLLVVFLAVWGLWFAYSVLFGNQMQDKWQAVFLSNGQVYFGHVVRNNKEEVHLQDIYYLQIKQTLQQGEESGELENKGGLSLVKLGNELHGPEDMMYINRDQIMFLENLREDSKVVQAIHKYAKERNSSE